MWQKTNTSSYTQTPCGTCRITGALWWSLSLFLLVGAQQVIANPHVNAYLLEVNQQLDSTSTVPSVDPLNTWDSWVEGSEVRLNTNDLSTLNRQSYALRLRLKNRQQQAVERDLLALDTQRANTDNAISRLNELRRRYGFIHKTLQLKSSIDDLNRQLNLARLETSTYKKLVTSGEFNPVRIQRAELEVNRLTTQLRMNNRLLDQYLALIGVPASKKSAFLNPRNWLISLNEMKLFVDQAISGSLANPALQKLNLASRIARKQRQLAKADMATGIQLLEVEYDRDRDNYGATIGVRVPLGKNSFDLQRRDIGYQQAQREWESKLFSIKNRLTESRLLLHQYDEAYRLEQQLQQAVQARLKRVTKTGRPDLILSLKKELAKHQSRQQETYLKLIGVYLDFIFVSGHMLETPMRNWLQQGRPLINKGGGHG